MNPVVHFEMPYRDASRAATFYASAFGWKSNLLGPQMGDYLLLVTAESDARPDQPRGAIQGGMFPYKKEWPMQHPSIVIAVPEIKAAMKRILDAGGKLLGEPMTIPGIGEYISFVDTEGNRSSILQPLES